MLQTRTAAIGTQELRARKVQCAAIVFTSRGLKNRLRQYSGTSKYRSRFIIATYLHGYWAVQPRPWLPPNATGIDISREARCFGARLVLAAEKIDLLPGGYGPTQPIGQVAVAIP
jgi:hypothetical protein